MDRHIVLDDVAARRLLADTGERQQHRQEDQVGDHQHGEAQACRQGQLANDRDIDQYQHGETDAVGNQRDQPRQKQAAEGITSGHPGVGATGDILGNAIHLLAAMGHANGEDQKGDQDGKGIQHTAEGDHQPLLPEHRDDRAEQYQAGAAHAAGVEVDDQRRHQRGDDEEQHDLVDTVDHVAGYLGKTRDVDADLIAFVFAANAFERRRQILVAQRLAIHGRQQRNLYHAGVVVG
ncbi:hypothetical protein D9M70_300210 [compost metagenome]